MSVLQCQIFMEFPQKLWFHEPISENWFGGVIPLTDYPYADFDGFTTENCNLNAAVSPPAIEVTRLVTVGGLGTPVSFSGRLEMFKLAQTGLRENLGTK